MLPISGAIFLDGGCWMQAREFIRGLDAYSAVLLDGRKYSIGLRPVLPGEREWKPVLPDAH